MCRNIFRLTILIFLFSSVFWIFSASLLLPVAVGAEVQSKASEKWTCPMHPHYIADEFGSCPICGMDLVKAKSMAPDKGMTNDEGNGKRISVPAHMIQTMGVRMAPAEKARFGRLVSSYGIVKANIRLLTEISARVEGWVEKLQVTAIGDHVKQGDRLFELFSPELIVSQRDYLTGLKSGGALKQNITQRLLSFGVQEQVLTTLGSERKIMQQVPFYAERSGTVSELNVTSGTYVKRGMTIAKIQDYSNVWVIVNVAEKDIGFIEVGTPALVYFPNSTGAKIQTKVDYIYPEVDEKTRTGQIRLVIENKDGSLRPGTYADVVFETSLSQRLSVPSEAILKSGRGDHVVISLGKGQFITRKVEVGLVSGGRSEIISGVKNGESVVTSAQFLLDSESALNEAFAKFEQMKLPLSDVKLSKNQYAMVDHIVDAALYLHEQLVEGRDVDSKFLDPAISIRQILNGEFGTTKFGSILEGAEVALKNAQLARTKSEVQASLNELLKAISPWLLEGDPAHYEGLGLSLYQQTSNGWKWVQKAGEAKNPYGDGGAEIITWPPKMETQKLPATMNDKQPQNKNDAMRGSHGMQDGKMMGGQHEH